MNCQDMAVMSERVTENFEHVTVKCKTVTVNCVHVTGVRPGWGGDLEVESHGGGGGRPH